MNQQERIMKGKYTDAIREAVAQAGSLSLSQLTGALGYTEAQVYKAVKDGAIYWRRDGSLGAI